MTASIRSFEFELLPQKAIHWPSEKTLLVADLHLGKINHYRRAGYPVPPQANDVNTTVLIDLLNRFRPDRTIFLGDLFHSHYNEEWEVLGQVLKHFAGCSFELVMGNHDIMSAIQYERNHVRVHEKVLIIGGLVLSHQPLTEVPDGAYNIAGHIHPGARLRGRARQSLTLPCFYFGQDQGILPAFGSFTGLYPIQVRRGDKVFVIVEDKVIDVDGE